MPQSFFGLFLYLKQICAVKNIIKLTLDHRARKEMFFLVRGLPCVVSNLSWWQTTFHKSCIWSFWFCCGPEKMKWKKKRWWEKFSISSELKCTKNTQWSTKKGCYFYPIDVNSQVEFASESLVTLRAGGFNLTRWWGIVGLFSVILSIFLFVGGDCIFSWKPSWKSSWSRLSVVVMFFL